MKIRKAVIPAAGMGTRFLPATKTIPKEMFPIVDKPLLMFIAEEVLAAGLEQLILVAGRGKSAIEDFFDVTYELEQTLETSGKSHLLKEWRHLHKNLEVISIRQHQALGLGHAVRCAEPVVGHEPFAVLLGDELMIQATDTTYGIGELVSLFEQHQKSVVAVMEVAAPEVTKYGIVAAKEIQKNLWSVHDVVEKPEAAQAPSRLALPGRYVFTPALFEHLHHLPPGRNGEIQLTDAMTRLAKSEGLLATQVRGQRFDAGDKLGYVLANLELGLAHPEIGTELKAYLQNRFGGSTR